MSRIIPDLKKSLTKDLPDLPIIHWISINEKAPVIINFPYKGPDASLPSADVVVITWTDDEWSALDHVFVNSQTTRTKNDDDGTWRKKWHLYSKDAPKSDFSKLWGYFILVKIKEKRVMLFKSDAHLAHPNYITGLQHMMRYIINDANPTKIYSIGTAGGASLDDKLGNVVITNAGHIILKKKENSAAPYNNQTISCDWFPSLALQKKVTDKFLMKLSKVLTSDEQNKLLEELHTKQPDSSGLTLDDLINDPLKKLQSPRPMPNRGIPLLTTDYYFIADGDDSNQYCALEMDDTVVGYVANQAKIDFAFIRNISDTVVVSYSKSGKKISDEIRNEWSSLIYKACGFYTSFNGALIAWSCIAAE